MLNTTNHDVLQSQAKSLAEQKRFPFATDNDNTNEELGKVSYKVCAGELHAQW